MKLTLRSGLCLISVVLAIMLFLTPVQAFQSTVSGQVNAYIMFADNGADKDSSEIFVGDNDNSSTRFRFVGSEKFEKSTIGYRIEIEAQKNASNTVDIGKNNDGNQEINIRWLDGFYETNFGKFSLGQGDGAANTTSEVDLSGTAVVNYTDVNATAGGFTWTSKDGNKVPDGSGGNLSIGDTRNNFDGLGRNERFRYDTPTFAGFIFAGSVTNGSAYELAGFFTRVIGEKHRIAAGLGYVDTVDRESGGTPLDYTQVGFSASYMSPVGVNLTGAYGQRMFKDQAKIDRELAGLDSSSNNWYLKLGWRGGMHRASVEYGETKDLSVSGKSSNYGLAYVVTPWEGVELFGTYRNYSLSLDAGTNPEDVRQLMAGTRIRF